MHYLTIPQLLCLIVCVTPHPSPNHNRAEEDDNTTPQLPLLISHRGDKVTMPEHTVASYEFALIENVDFVEPDLALTKDNVLVCYHDISLKSGTDVADRQEFEHLMVENRTLELEGKNVTFLNEWFIADFNYEQLRTLNVVQKDVGVRPQFFNSMFWIPTFDEFIDTVHDHTLRMVKKHGDNARIVGIIPELKHPKYHDILGSAPNHMANLFLGALSNRGYPITSDSPDACTHNDTIIPCSPLIVQSFEITTIEYLHETTNLTLLALLDTTNARYLTYKGLESLSGNTTYIGIWKELLYTGTIAEIGDDEYDKEEIEALGGFIPPAEFVPLAHNLSILVGIYTIYHSEEDSRRGCAVQCVNDTKQEEMDFYFRMGVDAFFVEGVCESYRIRDQYFLRGDDDHSAGSLITASSFLYVALIPLISYFQHLIYN